MKVFSSDFANFVEIPSNSPFYTKSRNTPREKMGILFISPFIFRLDKSLIMLYNKM